VNDEELKAIAQQIAATLPNKEHIRILEDDRPRGSRNGTDGAKITRR
jgi:hypothetical protein